MVNTPRVFHVEMSVFMSFQCGIHVVHLQGWLVKRGGNDNMHESNMHSSLLMKTLANKLSTVRIIWFHPKLLFPQCSALPFGHIY